MSVQQTRTGFYAVRWREGGRMRSKSFRLKRDAERFDVKVKDAKQTGTLAAIDGGTETLDDYVEHTWTPIHAGTLAPKTRDLYASLYDGHVSPALGGYRLRELTPEVIGRWQADRLAAGAPVETTRKSLTLLGGILQRALESGRIASNPQRLVRKAAPPPRAEVRPLAPATVERICAQLSTRDRQFVHLLAYAGLRPQEARALCWGHVGERTLTVHAPKTRRHSTQPRSVRLLALLAQDLREWRLLSGRPSDDRRVMPSVDNRTDAETRAASEWTEVAYENWIDNVWRPALTASGLAYQRPYDLRHSFASLLLHEGRSVIYVARQLGHSAQLTMRTYGHVIEELDDAPRISAEDAISAARRDSDVRQKCVEIE
jgi:integrase